MALAALVLFLDMNIDVKLTLDAPPGMIALRKADITLEDSVYTIPRDISFSHYVCACRSNPHLTKTGIIFRIIHIGFFEIVGS
jgi:hypothetical protein